MSVPNQKIVVIAPREKRDKNHLYAMMNLDALQNAVTDLNGSGLKLWLYLNKNQEGFRLELSQKAALAFGIKKDSYYAAVDELCTKGFLIPAYEGSNQFTFYETAHSGNKKVAKIADFEENQNPYMGNQNHFSETPERNNIYNTQIIQNKTMVSQSNGYCKSSVTGYKPYKSYSVGDPFDNIFN